MQRLMSGKLYLFHATGFKSRRDFPGNRLADISVKLADQSDLYETKYYILTYGNPGSIIFHLLEILVNRNQSHLLNNPHCFYDF